MGRALKFTGKDKILTYYSDIVNDFALNPITQQLQLVTNEVAVGQAIKNLILTNMTERFYHPEIGSKIQAGLFEFDDPLIVEAIRDSIEKTIVNNEPRVTVKQISVTGDSINNRVQVTVVFTMANVPEVFNTSFFVNRNR